MSRIYCYLKVVLLLGTISVTTPLPRAEAVIISTTTGNTTAPADDFGFSNVANNGGMTGIYLGYRWMLTAAHAGEWDVILNGRTYEYIRGTSVRLKNPTGLGLSEFTDLKVFRIAEDPWLPSIKIADTFLDAWEEVIMVGNGDERANTLKAWDVSGSYLDEHWTWTETDPPGEVQGYLMSGGRNIHWGTNRVEPDLYKVTLEETNQFIGFKTDFDQYGATEYEAQAAKGDSGGGVFHKNGDQWELAGIIHSVSDYPDQPSRALYGLETYCSDLSLYRDFIMEIITPLPGDANLDDVVDATDASIMAANWGRSGDVLWGHGDFNEDGVIDYEDAAILAEGWGANYPSEQDEGNPTYPIPEPSLLLLIITATLGLSWMRTRR